MISVWLYQFHAGEEPSFYLFLLCLSDIMPRLLALLAVL
jgi:hypothetical protein